MPDSVRKLGNSVRLLSAIEREAGTLRQKVLVVNACERRYTRILETKNTSYSGKKCRLKMCRKCPASTVSREEETIS
jgi:hypothetical protein